MNILATPIIIPMSTRGGGSYDPMQCHKIIIALSIVLFVIMIIALIVGFFTNKKYAKKYGWKFVWKETFDMPLAFIPLNALGFIAVGYAVYGIYLLL